MKKVFLQLLTGITAAALTFIVTRFILDPLSKWPRPLPWLLAFVVFLLVVIGLFSASEETRTTGLKRVRQRLAGLRRRIQGAFAGDPDVFRKFFDFGDEPIRIVNTCRSRIDRAPCPIYECDADPHLQHVINLHVPVDEFLTHQLMVQWNKSLIQREEHEGLIDRFTCSYPVDQFGNALGKDKSLGRSDLPDFMFENVIIIGENSCANLMLDRLYPILNFHPSFSEVTESSYGASYGVGTRDPIRRPPRPRIHIDLLFAPRNGNAIEEDDKLTLRTSFGRSNPNAVAMLCYAPNPFNLKKRVLILFGAHRVGQYLLEEWLHRHESTMVLRQLLKAGSDSLPAFGQLVLHGPFVDKPLPEDYEFTKIAVLKNAGRGQAPFFPFTTSLNRADREGFRTDAGATRPESMVDISLIANLPKHESRIAADIDGYIQEQLPFLQGHYWESRGKDTGLHVTLYEFATHPSHDTLAQATEYFDKLEQELAARLAAISSPCLTLSGCEVFSSAIVLYADLPVDFLDAILETCQSLLPGSSYLNRRRMPFPLHCTVLRFTKTLNKEEQALLRHFAETARKRVFGRFHLQTVSLQLARKQPYQEIDRRFDFDLLPRDQDLP